MSTNNSFAMDRAANVFDAAEFSAVARSPLTTDLPKKASSFAIATSGTFTDNGSSNFAGDLSNPFDDARLYAGGVTINGIPTFSGFGAAIAVGPGAVVPDAVRQRWAVENLSQVVAIDVPTYALPTLPGSDYIVDVRSLSLNNLKNVMIVVESGDLNFNGDRHLLENVTIVVKDGSVNLGDGRLVNSSVYSAGSIHMNQGARFSGKNLLMTEHGDVVFNGGTSSAPLAQSLDVIAHGNIYVNGVVDVHARFLASGSFVVNYDSKVVGSIRAQGGITFNAKVQVSTEVQPLIGIIDTGFNGSNPDIDYSRIILGRDRIDGDDNPLLISGVGNEHGTHVLGIIGATQNNGFGIDGINDQAPIWLGRAVGSGNWADSLIEFVDAAKQAGQPHSIANLSFDLTQRDANGRVTTRYELTPRERTALGYAHQNGVLIVVPAGNDGGVSSVLGQASQEFSNIITVGALGTEDAMTPTAYSNRGRGLNIVAYGGGFTQPVISTVGTGVGTMLGTSVAAAEVTGAASKMWEANPTLNALQIKEILLKSAIDLGAPGWDALTGSGRLNLEGAIALAQQTSSQTYNALPYLIPTTWSGAGKVTPTERPSAQTSLDNTVNLGRNPSSGMWSGTLSPSNEVDYFTFTLTSQQDINLDFGLGGVISNTGVILILRDSNGKNIGQLNSAFIGPQLIRGRLEPGTYAIEIIANESRADANSKYTIGLGLTVVSPQPGGGNPNPGSGGIPNPIVLPVTPVTVSDLFKPVYETDKSRLGNPITNATSVGNGITQQEFENGAIVSSDRGTFPIDEPIWTEIVKRGGVNGSLGIPVGATEDLGNGNASQTFKNGLLVVSNKQSHVITSSLILDAYITEGGAKSWLGTPTSNAIDDSSGFLRQEFEHGYIVWDGQQSVAYQVVNENGSKIRSKGTYNRVKEVNNQGLQDTLNLRNKEFGSETVTQNDTQIEVGYQFLPSSQQLISQLGNQFLSSSWQSGKTLTLQQVEANHRFLSSLWRLAGWTDASDLLDNYLNENNGGANYQINLDKAIRESSGMANELFTMIDFDQIGNAVREGFTDGDIGNNWMSAGHLALFDTFNGNWLEALGGFSKRYTAHFEVDPETKDISIEVKFYTKDIYDFDNFLYGITGSHQLHLSGLARAFEDSGTSKTYVWKYHPTKGILEQPSEFKPIPIAFPIA
jgi:hypothetical protein